MKITEKGERETLHTVFDRLADQVMHLSNAAISGSLTFDRDLLITIEMDYEGAAALADRLEQSEDNAKAERKAGAVDALREVERSLEDRYLDDRLDVVADHIARCEKAGIDTEEGATWLRHT